MAIHPELEVEAVTDTEGVTIPNPLLQPLKINEINGRRKRAEDSQWVVAAPSNTSSFKLHSSKGKPKARRWDHILSAESKRREGSSLKRAAKWLGRPGLISLGGGLPSSDYFPFDSLTFKAPVVGHFSEEETHDSGIDITSGKHDLAINKSIFDIEISFNYGQGSGAAQLLRWIAEHTELAHKPPYEDWACTMSVGSTYALEMAFRMLTESGDYILSEEYTFATAVETAAPLNVRVAGIKMDEQGLLPESMDEILTNWEPAARHGARKPFVLYTVPSGQNPTGATQGTQRRKDIYAVCQKHDVYILEDEPYYFLQMQPYTGADAPDPPPPASHEDFLKSLVPSLLSMDVDGRVMRMDSFSKVIAPGCRLGWITASEQIITRYKKHSDVSTQGPSGMSQLVLFKLLDEHWGHSGYLDWLIFIRMEYTKRRNVILDACERFLPDVVSWKPPMAGMFHWMQVDWKKHPHAKTKSVTELEEEIFMASIEHGSLVMRGSWFYAENDIEHDTMFFRATYAAAPSDKIVEAIKRFGDAVRESFGLPAIEYEVAENGNHAIDSNGKVENDSERRKLET
ncbi:PLP-dependent transferase [Rhizodiscina lignyota]|uniref:aromatic-amino-acid transaminase n=1 Tax=Rhizodiscina lignyota TaxID=1504668 RepID=A0A9P4IGM3_9PEZI|nr:PLP-dependent transferase [Rhizodiscina lignyota]